LKSAVPQVCNLRLVGKIGRLGSDRCPADYKSAIRQIENLRYGKHKPGLDVTRIQDTTIFLVVPLKY